MAARMGRRRAAGDIVFAHANSFPAGVYRLLFEARRARGYRVHAVDKFGHDPARPVTSNWPHLRDELIEFIQVQVGGPTWLAASCCWMRRSSPA